jgi:hypothetical protein
MHLYIFKLTLLIALALVGCNGRSTETAAVIEPTVATTSSSTATTMPTATATPQPTDTPSPTPMATPSPTETPQPTTTPTITPTAASLPISLEETYTVAAAGFSFRSPPGYVVNIYDRQVALTNPTGNLNIVLMGIPDYDGEATFQEILDDFLGVIARSGNGHINQRSSQAITIDGHDGLAVDVTGHLFGGPAQGLAVVVFDPGEVFFFGLAISDADPEVDPDRGWWQDVGQPAFTAFLATIRFLTEADQLVCTIATDESYGYTAENPIQVGGGALGGPSRGRAYLDNLLGPNGEELTYRRIGAQPFGDTILDIYEISGPAQPVKLYLDSYTSSPLQAPVGFSCASFFP